MNLITPNEKLITISSRNKSFWRWHTFLPRVCRQNKAQEKRWEEKCAQLQKKRDEAAASKEAEEARTKALLEEIAKKGDDDAPPSPPDEPEPVVEEKIPDDPVKPEPIQLDPPKSPALICRQRYDDTQESKVCPIPYPSSPIPYPLSPKP